MDVIDHKLSAGEAALDSLCLICAYVGCLYISAKTRPSETQRRDDPDVVYRRMTTVSVLTAALVLVVVPSIFIFNQVYTRYIYAWQSLGLALAPYELIAAPTVSVFVTAVLFVGPLYNFIVFEHDADWKEITSELKKDLLSIHGVRNYIVGPVTEELVFRSCILALYLSTNSSETTMILVTPLYFGVAHLHHAYEGYLHDKTHLSRVLLVSVVQFIYTTIFGWYASYIFLRTGSVWACISVHVFCNWLGLPPLTLDTHKKTLFYRILLVVGACGFYQFLPLIGHSNELRR